MKQSTEPLQVLELEIKQTLDILIHLALEEKHAEMNSSFAKLLAKVQARDLIDYQLNVLVEPQTCSTETCLLLQSLQEAKSKPRKRHKLLTHRMILKIWLRKNPLFRKEFLPQMF
ncbi:hypothetical protein P9B03_14570 [Metasolibacillus meyeri]|uniref:Uncharacterized protein n=1 Tax=Metasolibacillus meyeri TaxID=1071052 RepID=A0AAW9NTI2_9BACL|nr:hypothetical protein [Metasolibacillus meyeri]MEC1179721.1 hypothetical protein [Metasolibacillus meyeri]